MREFLHIPHPYGRSQRPAVQRLDECADPVWLVWALADGEEVPGHRALDAGERSSLVAMLERAHLYDAETEVQIVQGAGIGAAPPERWVRLADIAELRIIIRPRSTR